MYEEVVAKDALTAFKTYDAVIAVVADPDKDPVKDCAVTDCNTANDPLIVDDARAMTPLRATNSFAILLL